LKAALAQQKVQLEAIKKNIVAKAQVLARTSEAAKASCSSGKIPMPAATMEPISITTPMTPKEKAKTAAVTSMDVMSQEQRDITTMRAQLQQEKAIVRDILRRHTEDYQRLLQNVQELEQNRNALRKHMANVRRVCNDKIRDLWGQLKAKMDQPDRTGDEIQKIRGDYKQTISGMERAADTMQAGYQTRIAAVKEQCADQLSQYKRMYLESASDRINAGSMDIRNMNVRVDTLNVDGQKKDVTQKDDAINGATTQKKGTPTSQTGNAKATTVGQGDLKDVTSWYAKDYYASANWN
jgi:hypothetical protein